MAAAAAERRAAAIALPAYCCFDVATAADGSDVPVILYDIDPHTLAPDPDSLATTLRTEPAAVVVVHLFGVPVDLSAVARLVDDTTTLLVEDAAQGAGASYAGRRLGTMGSVSVLSFGRGKGITGGSGGALLANDERGARFLAGRRAGGPSSRGLRELCTLTAQWALARPGFYSLPASLPFLALGETVYRDPRPPAAPTAASSGVLSVTWALQEFESRVRRQNATRLLQHVDACNRLRSIQPPDRSAPGYLRLPVLAAPGVREAVSAAGHLGIMPAYPTTLASAANELGMSAPLDIVTEKPLVVDFSDDRYLVRANRSITNHYRPTNLLSAVRSGKQQWMEFQFLRIFDPKDGD